jgi:hypothetical protein
MTCTVCAISRLLGSPVVTIDPQARSPRKGLPRTTANILVEQTDPELWAAIQWPENARQEHHIELIASENYASPAVMAAQGSAADQQIRRGLPGPVATTAAASTWTWPSNWPSTG